MKKTHISNRHILLFIVSIFYIESYAQTVIDSCFSQVYFSCKHGEIQGHPPLGDAFQMNYPLESEAIKGRNFYKYYYKDSLWYPGDSCSNEFTKLVNHRWSYELPTIIDSVTGLATGGGYYAKYSMKTGLADEFIAFKLDRPLVKGIEFQYIISYVGRDATYQYHEGPDGYLGFTPIALVNNKPRIKGSYYVKKMKTAYHNKDNINIVTDTIRFVPERNKDVWLIFNRGRGGRGTFLSKCVTYKDEIFLPEDTSKIEEEKQYFTSLENAGKLVLDNVYFKSNEYSLLETSYSELNKLISYLQINSSIRIEISGHTDNVGSEVPNQLLSENRAKAVYNYLLTYDISKNRLTYVGFGSKEPLVTNDNEKNRSRNRRVEIKIISD